MSIFDKIKAGEYENKLPYSARSEESAKRRRKKQAYLKERNDLDWKFYLDLLQSSGLRECSYYREIFNYIWKRFNGSGLSEIAIEFEQFLDLLDKLQLLKDSSV